ncbi:MAG: twitching motility protein PilT, partial [Syntrophus sp. (in: bacteria)]|nr:twitching motility protein PilT [Syntrophus sp. (in: bacteria)]
MDIRFIADRNLGTLAKWLRILGYDTLYERGNADLSFLRKAAEEGRVALTRKRDLSRRTHPVQLVVVRADNAPDQLAEVLAALTIIPDPVKRMTLCLRCNAPLEAIPKETAEGLVPAYVYQKCRQFRKCPLCDRIFWPGTHRECVE